MDNQHTFEFDQNFDALLEGLDTAIEDRAEAQAKFKEHLWELVLITERRLQKEGISSDKAYKLSCAIIAEFAHYEGGRSRYLPRGDKLKQELRDIHMFRMWHDHSWPVERIHNDICPELNQIQVYKILRTKRKERFQKIQPQLL